MPIWRDCSLAMEKVFYGPEGIMLKHQLFQTALHKVMCLDSLVILSRKFIPMIHVHAVQAKRLRNVAGNTINDK